MIDSRGSDAGAWQVRGTMKLSNDARGQRDMTASVFIHVIEGFERDVELLRAESG